MSVTIESIAAARAFISAIRLLREEYEEWREYALRNKIVDEAELIRLEEEDRSEYEQVVERARRRVQQRLENDLEGALEEANGGTSESTPDQGQDAPEEKSPG